MNMTQSVTAGHRLKPERYDLSSGGCRWKTLVNLRSGFISDLVSGIIED